jgi:long-chain acyl-CoA synthetase
MDDPATSLLAAVASHARRAPSAPAVVAGDRVVTFDALWSATRAAAAMLREGGARRGDRIVLSATSSDPAFVFGYLASHLAGCIAVPVDPQLPSERLRSIVDQVQPREIFLTSSERFDAQRVRSLQELDSGQTVEAERFEWPLPDAVADILFTTGTTGDPKGVVLTHGGVLRAAGNINAFLGNTNDDREVLPLPLCHSFGLGRLRCNLLAGGTVILTPGFAFPGLITRGLDAWQATGLASVPAGFAVLLRMGDEVLGRYAEQLRYIEIGSAPMPLEHKQKLMALLPNTRICMHYGLTEASRSAFIEFHESAERLDSIGRPAPNVSVRIVDEADRPTPPGERGEIVVRGDHLMKEYYDDHRATARGLRSGWFHTGDQGHRDADGYLYLEAREAEFINVGGRKVSPLEVERWLSDHPGIAACACVGVPDPRGITGEVVKAFLVADSSAEDRPDEATLRSYLEGRLEAYKVPVAFAWIDSLPMASSGKVQRLALRDRSP